MDENLCLNKNMNTTILFNKQFSLVAPIKPLNRCFCDGHNITGSTIYLHLCNMGVKKSTDIRPLN